MRFCDWHKLSEDKLDAPEEAGIFQVRVAEGLLSYPKGKSAMFYYGYASNLKNGLAGFVHNVLPLLEVNREVLLVRWMPVPDTEIRFQGYLEAFHAKFGTLPLGNELLLHRRAQDLSGPPAPEAK